MNRERELNDRAAGGGWTGSAKSMRVIGKGDTLILRKIRGVANGSQLPAQVRQV